jgi:hypothetical protein
MSGKPIRGQKETTAACGFNKSYNQAADVPSSKGDLQIPTQPMDKLQNHAGFGFDDAFHHYLAGSIPDGNRNTFLAHIHADISGASP